MNTDSHMQADAALEQLAPAAPSDDAQTIPVTQVGEQPIVWDYRMHLLTDRFVLLNMAVVLGGSFGLVVLLIAIMMTIEGNWSWEATRGLGQALAIVAVILIVLVVLAMGVVMLNRADMTFTVDRQGVTCASGARERKLNRIALILGVLFGNIRLIGAALISSSREVETYRWSDARQIVVHPRERVICLRDSWHDIMRIYCPPDRFNEIAAFVTGRFDEVLARRERTARRAKPQPPSQRPYLTWLAWSVLVVVATWTSLAWYWAIEYTGPISLTAGILVLLSGLTPPGFQRLLGFLGAAAALLLLAVLALTASQSIGTLGYLWELDTGSLVMSAMGDFGLLCLAAYRCKTGSSRSGESSTAATLADEGADDTDD